MKIGEDSTSPFQLVLTGIAAGDHSYNAVATDNSGASVTSTPRVIVVTVENLCPLASIAGPTNATLSEPATVALTATASDPDGTVSMVEFYDDATKIGQKTSAPYTLTVSNVAAGLHTYTAVATDNQGCTSTSAAFMLTVTPDNCPPFITLLTPTNGFNATQPVNITFTATASDRDGFIAKVEYYRGATKLGQATVAPYSFTASNLIAGARAVTARAYDNQGATTDSSERLVIVRDTTASVIRCSTNRVASCTDATGTPLTFAVTATDNNDASVAIVCTPMSGSLFPSGTNVVNCTATDAAGNASSCSFNVIVLPSVVSIERAVIIRWSCGEVLQGVDAVDGPWSDMLDVASPYCVPSSQAKRFYRVRN